MHARPALVTLALALAAARPAAATPSSNGKYLNGKYLNGKYLNGKYLNGKYLNGKYLNTLRLGTGTELLADGAPLAAGSTLDVQQDDGSWLQLYVGGVHADGGVTYYRMHVLENQWVYDCSDEETYGCYWTYTGAWAPLCDGDNLAVALDGGWDYGAGYPGAGGKIRDGVSTTLACTSGAIGKCVQLGYRPWLGNFQWSWRSSWRRDEGSGAWVDEGWWEYVTDMDLAHEACTRMIRADYCADGYSHTEDGTAIDVADTVAGTNQRGPYAWGFEAVWTRDGAACLSDARFDDAYTSDWGCVCVFDGVCVTKYEYAMVEEEPSSSDSTWWNPAVQPRDLVPFAVGECAIPDDTLQNWTSTLPIDVMRW